VTSNHFQHVGARQAHYIWRRVNREKRHRKSLQYDYSSLHLLSAETVRVQQVPARPLEIGATPRLCLGAAPIRLNPMRQTDVCSVLWESAVRSKMIGAATFCLVFQLLAAASAPAQEPQPPTPPAPPFSGIARNVVTWLHHVTGTGTHHHRIASSPPLPRPRPAQLTKAPELPAAAVEPNEAPPAASAVEPIKISPAPASTIEQDKAPAELPAAAVEPNEAPPAASAVEPIKISPASAPRTEQDKAPAELPAAAVEPNEAPPAASAVEPIKISPASTLRIELDKAPAEPPAAAVKQTKAPNTPARTVLQGANIPD
jgi:hypothetical protein